jgi:hypothetical protein
MTALPSSTLRKARIILHSKTRALWTLTHLRWSLIQREIRADSPTDTSWVGPLVSRRGRRRVKINRKPWGFIWMATSNLHSSLKRLRKTSMMWLMQHRKTVKMEKTLKEKI